MQVVSSDIATCIILSKSTSLAKSLACDKQTNVHSLKAYHELERYLRSNGDIIDE